MARSINSRMTDTERQAVIAWLQALLEIRRSKNTPATKAKGALYLTREARVVKPIAIMISKELKRVGWDDRSWAARFALSGAVAGAAVFGGEGAGVAGLGTAIGLPLWIVIGAGAAFAGVFLDELVRGKNSADPRSP